MKTEQLRDGLFSIVTEPPCKECRFWDKQGHYCYMSYDTEHIARCNFIAQILKAFKDAGGVMLSDDQEMPKVENPHQAFRDALKRITPLTELGNIRNLQLKSLTTMQEALDSSNLACACARWGAFNDGSDARCQLIEKAGFRRTEEIEWQGGVNAI